MLLIWGTDKEFLAVKTVRC